MNYEDILYLPHHVSGTRRRMSMTDRAAQFSPFAALTGYDAAIRETQRQTECSVELDAEEKAMLNNRIRMLSRLLKLRPTITVTYFVPDQKKSGGAYECVTGQVWKIDPVGQTLFLEDGTVVGFERIRALEGDIFREEQWE